MRCAIFLLLFFSISPLHATTWGSDCSYDTQIYNVTLPSGKRISIDPNVAVGTVFFEHYVGGSPGKTLNARRHIATRYRGRIPMALADELSK